MAFKFIFIYTFHSLKTKQHNGTLYTIKTCFFNINGLLGPTALENEFTQLIEKYDIICLTETWHTGKNDLENKNKFIAPKGYNFFEKARIKRNKKAKRNSGRIIIFYKMELKSSISIHDNTDGNILWIKINGNTIENEHDLYVATVYNSPENSSYNINNENNDIFIKLQNKIATFSESDLLLIGGDFNARTGILADCLHEDEHDMKYQNFPNGYEIYKIRDRNNQDSTKNKYGEYLANFYVTTNVHILNGRTLGDSSGE